MAVHFRPISPAQSPSSFSELARVKSESELVALDEQETEEPLSGVIATTSKATVVFQLIFNSGNSSGIAQKELARRLANNQGISLREGTCYEIQTAVESLDQVWLVLLQIFPNLRDKFLPLDEKETSV